MSLTAERPATVPIVERRPIRLWSPAQVVSLALGVVAIVFGAAALARTGIDFSHLTRSHETLLGFGQTPLLGLAEIGFGWLLVVAAFFPILGRNVMTLIGAAALGLGVVVVSGWWSAKLLSWLGASDRDGWLFVAVGGFVLLTSFFTPVFTWGGPRVVRKPVAPEPEPEPAPDAASAGPAHQTELPKPPDAKHPDATEPKAPEPEPEEEPDVPAFVAGDHQAKAQDHPESRVAPEPEASKVEERAPVDATRA
jgi:hypothetical protein